MLQWATTNMTDSSDGGGSSGLETFSGKTVKLFGAWYWEMLGHSFLLISVEINNLLGFIFIVKVKKLMF